MKQHGIIICIILIRATIELLKHDVANCVIRSGERRNHSQRQHLHSERAIIMHRVHFVTSSGASLSEALFVFVRPIPKKLYYLVHAGAPNIPFGDQREFGLRPVLFSLYTTSLSRRT